MSGLGTRFQVPGKIQATTMTMKLPKPLKSLEKTTQKCRQLGIVLKHKSQLSKNKNKLRIISNVRIAVRFGLTLREKCKERELEREKCIK